MKKLTLLMLLASTSIFGKNITTEEVIKNLDNSDWVFVDTRDTNEYNGWNLDNLKVNGHIKGATDFSSNWLNKKYMTEANKTILSERVKTKGIENSKNIVLYSNNAQENEKVEEYLNSLGIKNIYSYILDEKTGYEKIPFEVYPNYEMIVPAKWVYENAVEKNNFKIFEVSWGSFKDDISYLTGHIKGAPHMNTDEVEPPHFVPEMEWLLDTDENLIKYAEKMGISKDDNVVLYGDDVMASYRLAIILKYLGVKDVRVLNGGLNAWKDAGYTLEKGIVNPTPIKDFGSRTPINKNLIVDTEEAKNILANNDKELLVDIRSYDERIGKVSGYSYMNRKGRIPGSVWGKSGTSSTTLEEYRNIDNTMRNIYEIQEMWDELGVDTDKKLTFFCGSGWRAAEVLFFSEVMGFEGNALYSDGWIEWSKKNPTETGVEEK